MPVRVSMATVAAEAGVSKNTVSLALGKSPRISTATRGRVEEAAARLGYQKNATVAHLLAEVRRTKEPAHQATLAILNANQDKDAFRKHPTIPNYVAGCRRGAKALGYGLDEIWLHDPKLDGMLLNRILRARGIRGIVVVGLMRESRLPDRFGPTWEEFPVVVTGVRTQKPALSFACTDHFMLARTAFTEAMRLGFRRPGLVLDRTIDELVDKRFSAGIRVEQDLIPAADRVPSFLFDGAVTSRPKGFPVWLERHRPDVILTLYNVVKRWVAGFLEQPALIQLEWRRESPEWAGMNQHNDAVGEAAVEMVVQMIHGGKKGVPEYPQATLIGSTWVEGSSLRAH